MFVRVVVLACEGADSLADCAARTAYLHGLALFHFGHQGYRHDLAHPASEIRKHDKSEMTSELFKGFGYHCLAKAAHICTLDS